MSPSCCARPRWSVRSAPALLLLLRAQLAGGGARAADRPYLVVNTAVAEEDEEQTWAVEAWFQRVRGTRSLTIAPEYAFDPQNSLQMEFRRVQRTRAADGHEIEIEYKHLFSRIERDGWGWGLVLSADLERPAGAPWSRRTLSASVPVTLPLGESEADGWLHLNPGVAKPRGERRRFTGALGLERQVWRRTTGFLEVARDDEGHFSQLGLRWWVQRERLAVDIAWQRLRGDDLRGNGVVLGIAWYDL